MKTPLTKRQSEVLAFIASASAETGRPPTVREIADHFGFRSPRAVSDHLAVLERKGWIERDAGSARGIRVVDGVDGIPIVGTVAAGHPILAPEHREGMLDLGNLFGIEDRFAVRVTGESMINCGIHDGDFVIVQRSDRVRDGQVALVYLEGEATVKRLVKTPDGYRLEPENDRYPSIEVTEGTPDFQVAGPVVGVVRRM